MSTVAKKVIMGSNAVAGPFEIKQSLIMEGSSAIYRTPSSTGNRRTWTLSVWAKRNSLGAWSNLVGGQRNSPASYVYFNPDNQIAINGYQSGVPTNFYTETTRVLRDVSAWYHIVVNWDTTQSTAANRMKIWVNGVQETSFDVLISPALNFQADFNLAGIPQYVGSDYSSSNRANGQLAEMHWLDGATKSPSDFGETNEDTGQWVPKEYEGDSYGTNGFYLKFASGAIGTDSSGQGNTQTIANLANSDVVPDSPTNNFATINSLVPTSSTFSEGNLKATMGNGGNGKFVSTIGASSGKYYMEIPWLGVANFGVGIAKSNNEQTYLGSAGDDLQFFLAGSSTSLYKGGGNNSWAGSGTGWSNNDMVGLALDATNQTIAVYKNGSSLGSYDYSSLGYKQTFFGGGHSINGMIYLPNFGQNPTHSGTVTAGSATDGNGIGLFKNAPPSGYLALCTANLPNPAIPLPSAQFNTIAYTGDGGLDVTGVGFQPDLVWAKSRGSSYNHQLHDAVRGATAGALFSNSTTAQTSYQFDSFDSDGFTTDSGNINGINGNNDPMVAWNWKANGSGSSNSDGTITSTVSANQTSGFSIVKYTGTGSNVSVGHGLNAVPELFIVKSLSTSAWWVYTTAIDGSLDYLSLNTTAAAGNASQTASTSTLFYQNNTNASIAYCFASKPGYSKIGVYTGNGSSTDGPFANCGFKPAWVMRKRAVGGTADWFISDAKINPINSSATGTGLANIVLWANTTSAGEPNGDAGYGLDFLSNGFKTTTAAAYLNTSGDKFLYMAFAESPFKYANAR